MRCFTAFRVRGRRRCRRRAPCRTSAAAARTACGSSSTCRRRCCRGSRRSRRARPSNDRLSTATNVAEPPRQAADLDGVRRRPAAACVMAGPSRDRAAPAPGAPPATARVRSSSAWSRSVCASSTSVLVATPAVKRSPTHAPRLHRRPDAVVGRRDRGNAPIHLEAALLDLERELPIELRAARGQRARGRGRFGLLGAAAAAVPERPADVDRHVP